MFIKSLSEKQVIILEIIGVVLIICIIYYNYNYGYSYEYNSPISTKEGFSTNCIVKTNDTIDWNIDNKDYRKYIRLFKLCKSDPDFNDNTKNISYDVCPGTYTKSQLVTLLKNYEDDTISSINLNGLKVVLYDGDDLTGDNVELLKDSDCLDSKSLGIRKWIKNMSSIKILKPFEMLPSETGKYARLITNCTTEGIDYKTASKFDLPIGNYSLSKLKRMFPNFKENSISSVNPNQLKVTLYMTPDLTGENIVIQEEPVNCLLNINNERGNSNWNNKTLSVKVESSPPPKIDSIYKGYQVYENGDILGGDFAGSPFNNTLEEECVRKCENTDGCIGLSHYKNNNMNQCWLKNKLDESNVNIHEGSNTFIKNSQTVIPTTTTIPVKNDSEKINDVLTSNYNIIADISEQVDKTIINNTKEKNIINKMTGKRKEELIDDIIYDLEKLTHQMNLDLYTRKY